MGIEADLFRITVVTTCFKFNFDRGVPKFFKFLKAKNFMDFNPSLRNTNGVGNIYKGTVGRNVTTFNFLCI
ncbi:hypothetical protein YTPLAS21_12140 [Candidatus Nitrosocosmicus sp.]|nr:hypothetical protein YTPLAS21_12140 [Candidatus Nitrosocosmicus sp.]